MKSFIMKDEEFTCVTCGKLVNKLNSAFESVTWRE